MPGDEPADESGTVKINATTTVTDKTKYGFNLATDGPFGLQVGGVLYGLLVWFESPAAVDRMIGALHDLKTQAAILEARAADEAKAVQP